MIQRLRQELNMIDFAKHNFKNKYPLLSSVIRHQTHDYVAICLDIETGGLELNSPIYQIAAETMGIQALAMAIEIPIGANNNAGLLRFPSRENADWWNKKQKELRDKILYPEQHNALPPIGLKSALLKLAEYIKEVKSTHGTEHVHMYSKHPFDFELLTYAYEEQGITTPWKYYETYDLFTLYSKFELAPSELAGIELKLAKLLGTNNHLHDAVYDVKVQKLVAEEYEYALAPYIRPLTQTDLIKANSDGSIYAARSKLSNHAGDKNALPDIKNTGVLDSTKQGTTEPPAIDGGTIQIPDA